MLVCYSFVSDYFRKNLAEDTKMENSYLKIVEVDDYTFRQLLFQ